MFDVNGKIAQTIQCIWSYIFFVTKSILPEMENFGDYLGDFKL